MRPSKILVLAAAGLVCGFLRLPPAAAQTQEAAEYEKRLNRIKSEIAGLRTKIADEEKKEKTMLSSLDRIGFTKSLLRNEMALLAMQLDKNRLELAAIRKNIPALQAGLDKEREALARILVILYKFGRFNLVRFILGAADLRSLLTENKNLSILAGSQERLIADYSQNLAELGQAAEALRIKEAEIQALIKTANGKKVSLDAEERKGRALVSEIQSNRKFHEQTMEELGVQARQLQDLLQKFEKQESVLPFPLVPFTEKRGKLPWPAGGKVVQLFGLQRHPRFNTVTMNNGVEIAAPESDLAVRAVHGGKVVFADYFAGYGNLMIIDHGQTYYSLYGHCAEFKVRTGDFVKAEQPIAVAGDTGSMLEIRTLYFEIRFKTKPLDPLQWLARR